MQLCVNTLLQITTYNTRGQRLIISKFEAEGNVPILDPTNDFVHEIDALKSQNLFEEAFTSPKKIWPSEYVPLSWLSSTTLDSLNAYFHARASATRISPCMEARSSMSGNLARPHAPCIVSMLLRPFVLALEDWPLLRPKRGFST
eukprot:6470101-Amphidinium_carterae.1